MFCDIFSLAERLQFLIVTLFKSFVIFEFVTETFVEFLFICCVLAVFGEACSKMGEIVSLHKIGDRPARERQG